MPSSSTVRKSLERGGCPSRSRLFCCTCIVQRFHRVQ